MRILYVEDNPANVSLVRRVARGHELIHYVDGEEALAAFDKDNPDFVLMDVQLAGNLTGLDVVKRLRASGHTLPIIAVTAYAMVGDRDRCIEAGCDDYMSKPLDVAKLVNLLQAYSTSDKLTKTEKPAEVVAPKPANDDRGDTIEGAVKESTSPNVINDEVVVKEDVSPSPSASTEVDAGKSKDGSSDNLPSTS